MFKRRTPRPWHGSLKEWFWPSAGWGRTFQYLGHRVVRIPDSSYGIAAGLACGAAVSFTPFIGFHLLLSFGLAWAIRANLVAAAIGTLVGNPWTFPLIWLMTYKTGLVILGGGEGVDIGQFMQGFNLFENPYQYLKPVLTPLLLGAIPYILGVWVVVYLAAKKAVDVKRQRKARRREAAAKSMGKAKK